MNTHPYFSKPYWQGKASEFEQYNVYPWMTSLSHRNDIFCAFWCDWYQGQLPQGFDYYILTYHIEQINLEWLKKQEVDGKIIVVFPGRDYNLKVPNVTFIGYTELHNDLNQMIEWHGIQDIPLDKKYKFSTICNRITQSKIWTTTQILESEPNSLVILNKDWLQSKNIHNWNPTGTEYLDRLTEIFRKKYINLNLSDSFDNKKDNYQQKNSCPWQPYYTDTAIHIVAGSFHYSYMHDSDSKEGYIYPGPDIDEKTLKCLLAGIPFLPGMQFEVYDYLSSFGLNFDYNFDTSFDKDPGNISRFENLCKLIHCLSQWSIDEIISATKESTEYNKHCILDKTFEKACNEYNRQQIEKIYKSLQ